MYSLHINLNSVLHLFIYIYIYKFVRQLDTLFLNYFFAKKKHPTKEMFVIMKQLQVLNSKLKQFFDVFLVITNIILMPFCNGLDPFMLLWFKFQ